MISNSKHLNVLLVDDHEILRDELSIFLKAKIPNIHLTLAPSGEAALRMIENTSELPDLILSDLDMLEISGKDLCVRLQISHPLIKVIILSMHNEKGLIIDLYKSGAWGFLSKAKIQTEMSQVLSCISEGLKYFPPYCFIEHSTATHSPSNSNQINMLSSLEKNILKHLGSGFSLKEIAIKLKTKEVKIQKVRDDLYPKLGVTSTSGLILIAIKNGLVD